jgi:hypothetical protein
MDLAAIETALTAWVEEYSGIPCEWGRQSQKAHAEPYVLAYLGAITKAGHDERIQTYDFDTDSTSVVVVGVRRLVLRLSFRAFSQSLGASARQYAETLRVALHSQSAMDDLRDADLAYIDSDELVDSDYIWSGRMVSQTDMDIAFGLRAYTTDANHDGSYIKYVNIDTQEYVVDEDEAVVEDESGDYVTVDVD